MAKKALPDLPSDLPDLPPGWHYAPLSSLVNERGISYGIVQPGSQTPDGVPIVRVNNIRNGRIATDDVLRVQPGIEEKYGRTRLKGDEVLLTLVGTLGEVAVVPKELKGWNVARAVGVIPVDADPDSRWVSICLRSRLIQHYIQMWATTTVQATFNLRDVARLPIPIAPRRVREVIAHILGTLDDKIELNRRMNETLEATARALFKSWFVDFDPVRAKLNGQKPIGMAEETAALFPDAFQDSELGQIPRGWRALALPEAIEVNPKRSLSRETVAPYLEMKNMPTRGHCPLGQYPRAFGSGTKFQNGDTLVARITPCLENGKTAYVDFLEEEQIGWGSTEYIVLRPKPPLPCEYAYFLARSDDFRSHAIQNMTGTSGRQRVPPDCLSSFFIAVPSEHAAAKFGEFTKTLMARIRSNSVESDSLAEVRDTLLPRLLSGEIRVPEAKALLEGPL